jgi:hypothetical protein
MERPQVADGGTASYMEGSCEYIEQAVADSRQGVVLQLGGGGGEMLTIPHRKNVSYYESFKKASDLDGSFGTIYAMEKGHDIWYTECQERV